MAANIWLRRKTSAKSASTPKAASVRPRPLTTHSGGKSSTMNDRRSKILQVATRRFAEFGFAATTVRQIADDVDILSGSLFHHFATKEEMLHEIVRESALQMRDKTLRIAKAPADAEEKLAALVLLDLGEMTQNQEVHAILYNERKLFRRREEFAYVLEAKNKAYLAWKSVIRDGIKKNLFRRNLDSYLTIMTIVRMLNTAADWYKREDSALLAAVGPYTLDQVIDFYLGFTLSAVRAPARISEPIPRAVAEKLIADLAAVHAASRRSA